MKIYTKHGDQGETGLFGGARVPKDHLRIQAYGTLDELNAVLGMVVARIEDGERHDGKFLDLKSQLLRVQAELFQLGAEMATPRGKSPGISLIAEEEINRLESEIDAFETELAPLKTFVLPGGTLLSSELHLARTVSRRAERETIGLHRAEPQRTEVLKYLNRLSDYLFVASRMANHRLGRPDVPWIAPHVNASKG